MSYFLKNWQADVVIWEIRVTSKNILPAKSSQMIAVAELERYTLQWNLKSTIDFSELKDHHR